MHYPHRALSLSALLTPRLCVPQVQTGFGRVGSHMWGFEAHGATPDLVTLGKPFGNGFPLSAVLTKLTHSALSHCALPLSAPD